MCTASFKRAVRAPWDSRHAITSCYIQHRPVQGNSIAFSQHLVCHSMQCHVITDVSFFGEYDEVAPKQSCHTGIHKRIRFSMDKQQCGVGHVLSDCGDLLEFLPFFGPCEPSASQFLCQALQSRGATTPKTNWLQVSRKFLEVGVGQSCPSWIFFQETRQESRDRFCTRPLQKNLYDQLNVWGGGCLSPRKLAPLRSEPGEKFLAEPDNPVIGNRFSWSANRFHGKIARCGARCLLTHQVCRVIH